MTESINRKWGNGKKPRIKYWQLEPIGKKVALVHKLIYIDTSTNSCLSEMQNQNCMHMLHPINILVHVLFFLIKIRQMLKDSTHLVSLQWFNDISHTKWEVTENTRSDADSADYPL